MMMMRRAAMLVMVVVISEGIALDADRDAVTAIRYLDRGEAVSVNDVEIGVFVPVTVQGIYREIIRQQF
ncbi:hypothetical protein [Brytella acorum]|nr:hypothetical protein [Brytella acorum]